MPGSGRSPWSGWAASTPRRSRTSRSAWHRSIPRRPSDCCARCAGRRCWDPCAAGRRWTWRPPGGPLRRCPRWRRRGRTSARSRSTPCWRRRTARWRLTRASFREETAMLVDGCYEGKVALVTGGGSGMGRAMAQEFARLGAAVAVAGRRPEPLEETVALIADAGGRAVAVPTDVRNPEQVEAMVATAVEQLGRLDVLVNNAAGNFVVKAEELSPNGWLAVHQRRRAADDRPGRGRRDLLGDRQLRLDRWAGHRALRFREGRTVGDDQDLGGGVGAAQHPGKHDLPGADGHGGRRRRALA